MNATKTLKLFFDAVNTDRNFKETIFTNIKKIYIEDPDVQVNLELEGIQFWTYPGNLPEDLSPVGGNYSDRLADYMSFRSSFPIPDVDVYIYSPLDNNTSGFQGLAFVKSLCIQPFCVTVLLTGGNIKPHPNFSFNADLVAHELGHVCGARHTFACLYIGENGESDQSLGGCVKTDDGGSCKKCSEIGEETEGCSQPGDTPEGRTIMGYCSNLTSAFTRFGPQPGALVRNGVDAALNCNSNTNNDCLETDIIDTLLTNRSLRKQKFGLKQSIKSFRPTSNH